jgi:hypothetical protein
VRWLPWCSRPPGCASGQGRPVFNPGVRRDSPESPHVSWPANIRLPAFFSAAGAERAAQADTFEPLACLTSIKRPAAQNTYPQLSGIVRRPEVGELGKQIAVGPYLVPRHFPVCEDSQEGITGVVGERPAIAREYGRARGVIGQYVR